VGDNHCEGVKYGAILADPPWHWKARSPKGEGRSAKNHYDVMDAAALEAMTIPAADDCALFMWAIDPMLPQALELIKAWGFTYKTVAFTWAKINKTGKDPIGGGYWTRANPEMCLLATRGKPKRLNADVRQLLMAPRREHSRKPDEACGRIERLVGGPYLEIFARQTRPGWDSWGNEVKKLDEA
jgi:N6-adenosine-specific RNA methylase IME4